MDISTADLTTRADCDDAIGALEQRKADLEGVREFRFVDAFCIGGRDHPYHKPEPEALEYLRRELVQGGKDSAEVESMSWEQLRDRFGWDKGDAYQFDVTRQGCQQSSIFVSLVPASRHKYAPPLAR